MSLPVFFILTQGFSVVDGRLKMFKPKIRTADCINPNIFTSVRYRISPFNIREHYINIINNLLTSDTQGARNRRIDKPCTLI